MDSYVKHVGAVESLSGQYKDHKLLIMGDYNLPKIQWRLSTSLNIPVSTLVFETSSETRPLVTGESSSYL